MRKIFVRVLMWCLILNITIVVHELAHFAAAKAYGVHCESFCVGFGPKVTLFQTGETKWQVGALPIAGGVSMLYDDGKPGDGSIVLRGKLLNELSRPQQFLIFAAGVAVNIALGIALLAMLLGRVLDGRQLLRALLTIPAIVAHLGWILIANMFTFGRYPARKVVVKVTRIDPAAARTPAAAPKEKTPQPQSVDRYLIGAAALNIVVGISNALPIPGMDGYWIFTNVLGIDFAAAAAILPKNLMYWLVGFMALHAAISYFVKRKETVVESNAQDGVPTATATDC